MHFIFLGSRRKHRCAYETRNRILGALRQLSNGKVQSGERLRQAAEVSGFFDIFSDTQADLHAFRLLTSKYMPKKRDEDDCQ